jgi:hypothetical protein
MIQNSSVGVWMPCPYANEQQPQLSAPQKHLRGRVTLHKHLSFRLFLANPQPETYLTGADDAVRSLFSRRKMVPLRDECALGGLSN